MLGSAVETLLVVASKAIPDLERSANRALEQIANKISDLGLQIAAEKTEAVLFTGRYKYAIPEIRICGTPIKITDQMTYLGVVIDRSCFFKSHIQMATQKVQKVGGRLARLMPNVGGHRATRRRLLTSVVNSVLLYGTPSWAYTLDLVSGIVKLLNKTQRKVLLRKVCAYRTVSGAAACVIAATPPADLLARSREVDYLKRRSETDGLGYPTKEMGTARRRDNGPGGLS